MPALSVRDYRKLEADTDVWIWKGIIPVSGSMLFFGNPKIGKSLMTLGLCEAVANPNIPSFLGLPIQRHGRVLYIQLDTPRSLWMTGYLELIKSDAAQDGVFTIDREMKDLPKGFDIRIPEHRQWLRLEVDSVCPVLVIIDTVRRMHKGNEDKSDVMADIHDSFIQATEPAALMYIAHKKKPQQGDTGPGSVRGSSGFAGAVDALVNMAKNMLYIEARSDAPEEIPIMQLDNGSWILDDDQEAKQSFIAELSNDMPKMQRYKAIMDQFEVSLSTARRLEKGLKKVSNAG